MVELELLNVTSQAELAHKLARKCTLSLMLNVPLKLKLPDVPQEDEMLDPLSGY
jgi:hypothetical protein